MTNTTLKHLPGIKILFMFCSVILLFVGIIPVASAVIVKVDPTTSVIHTSGGLDGTGFGDLLLAGSFSITLSDAPLSGYQYLNIQNIDVHVAAVIDPVTGKQTLPADSLALPTLVGIPQHKLYISTTGGVFIDALTCPAFDGSICPDYFLNGIFDGTNFSLDSHYFSNFPDDYSYDTTINATVVPLPAAVWLMGLALLSLTGTMRRNKSQPVI